jgi:tetratricopeptide (TPR) repeat protein
MSQHNEQILIDHLDSILGGNASQATSELIAGDKELAKEWQAILFAVEGIREAGLNEQVIAAKKRYNQQRSFVQRPAGGGVRTIYRNVFRVAACFLLVFAAAAIYKYNSVSSEKLFNEYYGAYELGTTRSNDSDDAIENAYRAKNWSAVIQLASSTPAKTRKTFFLHGIASMELKKYNDAIGSFKQVLALNASTGDAYFHDEAEYYLALSYLASGDEKDALPLIDKMRSDKQHSYHAKANELSGLDIRILEYKADK